MISMITTLEFRAKQATESQYMLTDTLYANHFFIGIDLDWLEHSKGGKFWSNFLVWSPPWLYASSVRWQIFKIFWLLSASKPKWNFGHWSKMTLKLPSYLLPKFSRMPFTIVMISRISTMVNGTLLNFGKRYEDD